MMSVIDIVREINEQLETTWTNFEWKNGKKITIYREWVGKTEYVIKKYRNAGWTVKKEATISSDLPAIDVYFIFSHPESYEISMPGGDV